MSRAVYLLGLILIAHHCNAWLRGSVEFDPVLVVLGALIISLGIALDADASDPGGRRFR